MATLLAGALVLSASQLAAQQAPLSAIDWLSQSVAPPVVPPRLSEPPVTGTAEIPQIIVTPLDGPSLDRLGLYAPSQTGLPPDLWAASPSELIVTLVQASRSESLPAMQELSALLMAAQAAPPLGAGPQSTLYFARVDKLLDLGLLDMAQALLAEAQLNGNNAQEPARFRRSFDIALLTGTEDAACAQMQSRPDMAPTLPARVFCLARNGDWQAAALTLNTARVLGDVTDEEEELLSRFLDPALADGAPRLPPPERLSPLVFRLREAIGEAMPTAALPLAFAHADLRPSIAWRYQLEAVERLARTGAVPDEEYLRIFLDRTPAASGGIWDRAAAIQRLDQAINARDPQAAATALLPTWEAMKTARTELVFARLYAARLSRLKLPAELQDLSFQLTLLTPDYESAALGIGPASGEVGFLAGLARGNLEQTVATTPKQAAILAGFSNPTLPAALTALTDAGRLGEALLRAISIFNQGFSGDPAALSDALALLRSVGLEDVARRTALQYLLLERQS
ncbi:MAG: hypothetical protein JKX69_07330 [Rhodobacteraceae bacterium]|nr:hypothetical protein [Paracoccaceae bacterium]